MDWKLVQYLRTSQFCKYFPVIIFVICTSVLLYTFDIKGLTCLDSDWGNADAKDEAEYKLYTINIKSQNMIEKMHKERIKRLRFYCFDQRTKLRQKELSVRLHFVHKHNIAVCKNPKIGGTFLMQMFLSLNRSEFQSKSFGKRRNKVHDDGDKLIESYNRAHEDDKIFLVSRNPYSRLYSAYIDRIFLPGTKSYSSKLAKENKKRKGKETTFEEFLKAVTSEALSDGYLNKHWKPVYNNCEPCVIPYDIIAKQESYSEDMLYVLSKLNVSEEFRTLIAETLHSRHTTNSIREKTKVMYYYANDPNNVFGQSFIEFCERLWNSYQIQGYIRSSIRFPKEKFKKLNYSSLKAALDIYLHYAAISNMTQSDSDQQRHQYLSDAYKSIPKMIISKIQEAYFLDFLLFDYDMKPP